MYRNCFRPLTYSSREEEEEKEEEEEARAWNSLPAQTRTTSSLITFRRQTKAYLFRQSFG